MAKQGPRPNSKKAASPTSARALGWKLAVHIDALEVTAGHDGLLRGEPEPTVLVGAYLVTKIGSPRVKPLGRLVTRFVPKEAFPSSIMPAEPSVIGAKIRATHHDRIIVFAVALEEDSGKDISAIYTLVAESGRMRIWDADALVPTPRTLAEMLDASESSPPWTTRVNLLDDGADVSEACSRDDFVGACIVVLNASRRDDVFRAHFQSADLQNDWTAVLRVSLS